MSAILFDHVSKAYDLQAGGRTIAASLKIMSGMKESDKLFYSLTDVSFEVKKGEACGLIGKNGAGKSTILKIVAGITQPTTGRVSVGGLVSSLIELGAGFHPELTGRENVYMSGAILGIPKKEIDTKFNDIVDFAELWDFIDVPVKKYSSGMYARLGFSVAVSVNPDILIIDETLSVGDIFFQQKCFKRIRRLLDDGITLFFVSHDLTVVQTVCPRAILVDRGVIKYDGPSVECVSLYYALNAQGPKSKAPAAETSSSPSDDESNETVRQLRAEIMEHDICGSARSSQGDLGMEITGASFQNEHGDYNMSVEMMKTATIRIILKANQFIPLATAGFSLFDRMNNLIFSAGLTQVARGIRSFNSGEQRVITYRVQFSVKPGEYVMALGCAEADTADLNQGRTHHRLYGLGPVQVYVQQGAAVPFHGMASMPMEVSVLG